MKRENAASFKFDLFFFILRMSEDDGGLYCVDTDGEK